MQICWVTIATHSEMGLEEGLLEDAVAQLEELEGNASAAAAYAWAWP